MSNPDLGLMKDITHRFVETNGIRMHIAEAGSGPLVLLLHGFPEFWYSWRQQVVALAEAGFHAVAPDQRGFGQSDRPEEVAEYTMLHLVGDVVGLLDELGAQQAVAGHDWGASVTWNTAQITAPSMEQALRIAGDGKPGRRVRLHFLIDPEVFFVPEDPGRREVA